MVCGLYKYKKEIATHYVSKKTGREYLISEYHNLGTGEIRNGKKDLPDEYPYSYKYKTELIWKCCQLCSCDGKENY